MSRDDKKSEEVPDSVAHDAVGDVARTLQRDIAQADKDRPPIDLEQALKEAATPRFEMVDARSIDHKAFELAKQQYAASKPAISDFLNSKAHRDLLSAFRTPKVSTAYQEAIRSISAPKSVEMGAFKAIRDLATPRIDPSIQETIRSVQQGLALSRQVPALQDIASAHNRIKEQIAGLNKTLTGTVGEIAKMSQWSKTLLGIAAPDLGGFDKGLAAAIGKMRTDFAGIAAGEFLKEREKLSLSLGLQHPTVSDLPNTRLKMSVLAGVDFAFQPAGALSEAAHKSLFGTWRTRPDLPERFWQDLPLRREMYDAASVDRGLADATPEVALEVMIESGLTLGLRSNDEPVAIIAIGETEMTIRSKNVGVDAFSTLTAFEQRLRAYISYKLRELYGEEWFSLRSSNLLGKAKKNRKAAVASGEPHRELVEYVDLGELTGIITSDENWSSVFAEIFANKALFIHDMQRILAIRRPTMHARLIDGLQLVEAICVMGRLERQMVDDGSSARAAEKEY